MAKRQKQESEQVSVTKRQKHQHENIDEDVVPPPACTCFTELGKDVKLKKMEYLSEADLMKLSCVCSDLLDLIWGEDYLWKNLLEKSEHYLWKKLLEKFQDPVSNPEWSWNHIFGGGSSDYLFGFSPDLWFGFSPDLNTFATD